MIDPASPLPDEAPSRPARSRPPVSSGPSFAHASEAEMSRILDFYGVGWRYEPTTFPILWNLEGEVVESFSPDFYLPEFDLYLEMTTLKQSLVRKKNRKLRRLRELYPDVRIKLFYARDFRAMMLKYGRLGLAESLTGTSGQLVAGALAAGTLVSGPLVAGTLATEPPAAEPPAAEPQPVDRTGGGETRAAPAVLGLDRRRPRRSKRPSADVEIA